MVNRGSKGHRHLGMGSRQKWSTEDQRDIVILGFVQVSSMVNLVYAFSDPLLLTPLCCDDIHDVTPRVSALAGCDRLVSKPLVIEK
ncbi:hypothetical protein Tco_0051979 [Tanacetum coccineum]